MTSTAATRTSHDQQPGRSDMDEHQRDEHLRTAYRAADQEWRAVNEAAQRVTRALGEGLVTVRARPGECRERGVPARSQAAARSAGEGRCAASLTARHSWSAAR